MPDLWVNGVVAVADKLPYVQISNENGIIAQMSMAEARDFAMDILQMSARTEADAMILRFFEKMEFPQPVAGHLLVEFRDFRASLDEQEVVRRIVDPGEEK